MKYFIIAAMSILFSKYGFSQNHCTTFDELFRKRHKISNMTYGHPDTTFDRHNKLSFERTKNNWQLTISNKQNLFAKN
jgi:hypothetical protein